MNYLNFETSILKWFIWIFLLLIIILLDIITTFYHNKKASIYGSKKFDIKNLRHRIKEFIITFIVFIGIIFFTSKISFYVYLWILGLVYFYIIPVLIVNISKLIGSIQFFNLLKNDSRYASLPSFPPSLIFVWFALLIGFTYLIKPSLFLLGGFFILCILGIENLVTYINFFRKHSPKTEDKGSFKKKKWIWWIILIFLSPLITIFMIFIFTWIGRYIHIPNKIENITYGNKKFVAVGNMGEILNSLDGIDWESHNFKTSNSLYGITYGNNKFVAVGNKGMILTSPNGITWAKQTSGVTECLDGITYGNNEFVAVGFDIITSSDGIYWVHHYSLNNRLKGIAYGDNKFVAVGGSGRIITFTDGKIITLQNSGTSESLSGITYGDNKFVAVGDFGAILTSPDGKTWTKQNFGVTESLGGIIYGNKKFVAVGEDGKIITSPDGENWTRQNSGIKNDFQSLYGIPYTLEGIAYGDNKFIAIGSNGIIINSSDGKIWTLHHIYR